MNLTSERLREAAWLLDGVRQGQPLGALLGYRFERALHERHPGLDLDECIAPLRALEPIAAGKLTEQGGHATEAVAAANVVDGLRLLRRSQAGGAGIPYGTDGLPAEGSAAAKAVDDELARLAELVDGVADTILAESVHHLTTGRPDAASGSLDALSRGDTPPPAELDVARTPRRGTGLTHRVAVLLRGNVAGGGWAQTPRSGLEPVVEAWVAGLLPAPADVGCAVELFDGKDMPLAAAQVTLDTLGVSALDLVYVAVPGERAEASEIEHRVAVQALTSTRGAVRAVVRFDDTGGAAVDFPSALWTAGELRALLDTARPLVPADLAVPGAAVAEPDPSELARRLAQLARDLAKAAKNIDIELQRTAPRASTVRRVLTAAATFGIRGAIPVTATGKLEDIDAMRLRAAPVLDQLLARADALTAALGAGDWKALADAGRAAFGATITLLPRFDPGNVASLNTAIGASAALLDGDEAAADDFLLDASLVRPPLARLTSALTVGRAPRADVAPDFAAVQLPLTPGDRWAGLPLKAGGRPIGGRVSLLLHAPNLGGTGTTLAGFLVDEWLEVIPEPDVATGLAFHHAAPAAAPPQAVLLAVAPDAQRRWSLDALEAILLETLDLAKLRLVDIDALADGGALVPAAWFAYNTRGDTVSTDFTAALEGP